jgi:hypothetical protein
MKYYHGYWPVLAIIKQYLTNVKKRLARDLNAEQQDLRLPAFGSGKNAKDQKRTIPKDAKSRLKVLSELEVDEDEVDEDEVDEDEVDEDEVDEDEVDEDEVDEDETDPEDDRAEMALYEHYKGALEHEKIQTNASQGSNEGDEGEYRDPLSSKKSVEYQLLFHGCLLT